MKILEHFDRVAQNGFIIYRLKDAELTTFLNKLTTDFRVSYISDSKLQKLAIDNSISAKDFLEKYVLPDDGKIKSGDFGEMLSYFAVIENFENKGILLLGPRKWRWKDRNKAAQYTDSILFHISNPKKFSKKDLLVTIESKMKAVKSNKHRIQDAIDGATDDKLSRMAKTLIWLEEKYARLGKPKQRIIAERFKDPATHGSFDTKHKAIAIMDKDFETEEISKAAINTHGVTVIVFSIKELQKAYEQTRVNVIQSA
jgi:hypothetical protein